jgi:MerR family transcriptional regulator, light-induced transcriptional regulator
MTRGGVVGTPEHHAREEERRRSIVRSLRVAYTDALIAGDPVAAEVIMADAIAAELGPAAIDDEVIAPAMRRIGELWRTGTLSVAEEHLATEISFRVLALQREAFRVAAQRARQTVVLAAVQGERHVMGLRMAGDLLAAAGYDARLLGADVPLDALTELVDRLAAGVVALTATMPESAAALDATLGALRAGAPRTVVVGGVAVPEGLHDRPGLTICRYVVDIVEAVDALVQRPDLN